VPMSRWSSGRPRLITERHGHKSDEREHPDQAVRRQRPLLRLYVEPSPPHPPATIGQELGADVAADQKATWFREAQWP
jgi:hypothetical protein